MFAGETGYVLLMAAAVLAAWFGGLIGGLAAIITALVLNEVVFLGGDATGARADQLRQIIVFRRRRPARPVLVATRRASRDRLVDALDEVAALAETVEDRDARLELVLAASGTGFWEWDIATGELTWSDAIFEQHGMAPGGRAPTFQEYLEMIHPDDREAFRSGDQVSARRRRVLHPRLPHPVRRTGRSTGPTVRAACSATRPARPSG